MKFTSLLAKSLPKPDGESDQSQVRGAAKFTGHISLVLQAANVLTQELGSTVLRQLGLESVEYNRFINTVKLAAYLHDWGKANQHFQEMVYLKSEPRDPNDEKYLKYKKTLLKSWREHNEKQMLRHEVISGILALEVDSFRNWLEKYHNADLMVAVWAAMGHHLKMGMDKYGRNVDYCIAEIPDGTGDGLNIYTHHHDFQTVLDMGKKHLGLPNVLPELPQEHWSKTELEQALVKLQDRFSKFEKESVDGNWEYQKFIAAVKAMVISADLAGSALPVAGEKLENWIQENLAVLLSKEDIQKVLDERLQGKKLYAFQEQVAEKKYRVKLVKAGCGTGKTIGAYAWAKNWIEERELKLFFCYPTTGTASQGYLDYAHNQGIEAELMHSRAALDKILFSGDSGDSEGIDARLEAFKAWSKKLIVCTVDTVLGLIQNNRKPLYSFPALAQAAFVFDEVHAYDDRLFGALLQFLKTFRDAPILLMSASFSQQQLQAIHQVMADLDEEIDAPVPGPKEIEELKRYEIQSISEDSNLDTLAHVWEPVLKALENKQKILWVTNSVKSCINLYRLAKTQITQHLPELETDLLIYHSRYRYKDRLDKHKKLIHSFKPEHEKSVLAITTQVCEMSLDISADLLISAMAPAAALIQRLGRLNRRMEKEEEGSRLAIIYPWENSKPYDADELFTGKLLLERLTNKDKVSQFDLSEILAEINSKTPEIVRSNWLEGNWCSYPGFLRQEGYTITVLLGEDETKIWEIAKQKQKTLLAEGQEVSLMKLFKQEAQAWSVPIRIEKDWWKWKRKGFYPITPIGSVGNIEEVEKVGVEQ